MLSLLKKIEYVGNCSLCVNSGVVVRVVQKSKKHPREELQESYLRMLIEWMTKILSFSSALDFLFYLCFNLSMLYMGCVLHFACFSQLVFSIRLQKFLMDILLNLFFRSCKSGVRAHHAMAVLRFLSYFSRSF